MKPETANRTVIIAALDRSPATDQVVHTATSLACGIAGAELHLVHTVDAGTPPSSAAIPPTETFREAHAFLDETARGVGARFRGGIVTHLAAGEPARQILQLAADLEADLIVVGSHGKKALERLVMGSVSLEVVKKAPCAVLVARPKVQVATPEIEPPCPKCLEVQRESQGRTLWCTQHSTRHAKARLHYETPQPFALGSTFFRPDV